MSKFVKIIIDRRKNEFRNIHFLPQIIALYEKFSKYLHDDFFISDTSYVDAVINLVEATSPYFWAVVEKKSGNFSGFAYLENWVGAKNEPYSAEVTTCFKPSYWGKYTKLCASKFIRFCFKKYKIKKIKASVFPQNFKVRGILKSLGFKKEGTLKAETIKGGLPQDIDVYSIVKKQ